ncbi:MAG: hypothetical protein L0Z50_30655 [Verrucomicrobiales bacterium]|nr:hypothetical protein [Verrucomicrobiales bacterium]
MKIKNTTDWPTWFLRRMAGWCCRQLELPALTIKLATFRNSRSAWGGAAYYWKGKITVCVGEAGHFPTKGYLHGNGHQNGIADRLECLVWVTAHEIAHCLQADTKTRGGGGGGGSEICTEWFAKPVLEKFRQCRDALLAEWNEPPAIPARSPKPTVKERRRAKSVNDLTKWQRKLKLAQTKVRKLKVRVRYYERQAGNNS